MSVQRAGQIPPAVNGEDDREHGADAAINRDRRLVAQLIGELIAFEWLRERETIRSLDRVSHGGSAS